jgi:hypothetical protein
MKRMLTVAMLTLMASMLWAQNAQTTAYLERDPACGLVRCV